MKTSIVTRWAAAAAVAVASLVAIPPAPVAAAPGNTNIVINEVYPNGGSATGYFKNRFYELYNPTSTPINVNGWSLQYRSPTNTTAAFGSVSPLGDKTIAPGGYLLISGPGNTTSTVDLPTPDVTSTVGAGAGGGQIALSKAATALPAAPLTDPNLVDLVGYGTSVVFEGEAAAPVGGPANGITRGATHVDTDNNASDFSSQVATPCNSAGCYVPPAEPPAEPPVVATIAEIQGSGARSPLVGRAVTTKGVVTAVYKTGGYNGAFVQTPGTGGPVPNGRTTSDGIFVFGSAFAAAVNKGDFVEVTGPVSEFGGTAARPATSTQVTPASGGWRVLSGPTAPVTPAQVTFPLDATQKEALESMLVAPQGTFTITNNFATNQYGEIGLAPGSKPFDNPTNVVDPGALAQQLQARNDEALVTLDDGSSINFLSTANNNANQSIPLPWLTPTNEVRVGQSVTFDAPVVLDWRNSLWKLQPLEQLAAGDDEPVVFGPSTRETAPEDVGGSVTIGTFNVLNYFSTTAEEFEADALGTCSTFDDRTGDPVTADSCSNNGPRGAAEEEDFQRQQTKIVNAINALDASVVSLEEIENSVAVDPRLSRDDALGTLVAALNSAAGEQRWAFVPSPSQIPAGEDVIRTAFIYQPSIVTPEGASKILVGAAAFDNAREPLAQAFRPVGGDDTSTFAVVVNHFKSKSSGTLPGDADAGDGQGASNASRVAQAEALVTFADSFAESANTDRVFLTGDFNAYSKEDPIEVLEDAGYVNVPDRFTDEETYQFGGGIGSLDHVFASPAANAKVTGADIWNINAFESVAREYSRYNYNVTNFYDESPFRASDHDPTLIGYDAGPVGTTTTATAPASIRSGKTLTIGVSVTGGKGAATGAVLVTDGDKEVGTGTLAGGKAEIEVANLSIGTHTLTVSYVGDATHAASSTTVTTQVLKATAQLTATVGPATYGKSATLTVTGAPGASGFVYVASGDQLAGMGMMTAGTATITLSRRLPVGTSQLTVFYAGSAGFDPTSTSTSVTVAKASTMLKKVSVSPSRIVVKRTKAFVTLSVKATGFTVDGGKVTLRQSGKNYSGTVKNGKVRIRLGKFTSKGSAKKITATYSGNSVAKGSKTSFTVKVRAK
ncbi:ExeM/NucH family extracellular endonuclease [Aeromicrobium wangtongii]|uniref:ExeM/NucH family extracellular endonuclease n=1 Tax=Aeromicrobium wangtongii TaxID=2969247 RepID=UPI00201741AF|nr:ExeM/NucH family extracellular endonuclease [Aeromicrobium wangtongii]MCL3819867.1 ExeM/NucH family extracellular endonuclease [Aeromicrobium wangtongii]